MDRLKASGIFCSIAKIKFEDSIAEFQKLEDSLRELGYLLQKTYNNEGVQAFLCRNEEGQVLVFRDTEQNIEDWANNIDYKIEKTPVGECHRGFYRILRNMYSTIVKDLTDMSLLVVGYSQGGGLAIIFSKMLNTIDKGKSFYVSLEPPRISNNIDFNNNGIVTIVSSDIVPRIPFRKLGFKQQRNVLYWDRKHRLIINPSKFTMKINFILCSILSIKKIITEHDLDKVVLKCFYKDIENILKFCKTKGVR